MERTLRRGVAAAAVLPSALAAALLVGAPFAGTTTAPLADSHTRAATRPAPATAATAPLGGGGIDLQVPRSSVVTLVGAELALVGVGAGVIVVARRRRAADEA